jgi:hypothetical protein
MRRARPPKFPSSAHRPGMRQGCGKRSRVGPGGRNRFSASIKLLARRRGSGKNINFTQWFAGQSSMGCDGPPKRSRYRRWCSLATLENFLWCCDAPVEGLSLPTRRMTDDDWRRIRGRRETGRVCGTEADFVLKVSARQERKYEGNIVSSTAWCAKESC